MDLADLLFRLCNNVDVRVKFIGSETEYHITTGPITTGRDYFAMLAECGNERPVVRNIYPLFHAQELYVECEP